jgi:predicted N-acetyltransferase YhbS
LADIAFRIEQHADRESVEQLTFAAFETMKMLGRTRTNEHFLVHLLRNDPDFVPELDFVAEQDGEIVGNIMYSRCKILRSDDLETEALMFGPVSVKPELHGRGIGHKLIRHSLGRASDLGYKAVLITGHPDYYRRFGFVPANEFGITMPDGASFDAFMALEFEPGALGRAGGKWFCCKAFYIVEIDEAAFEKYHEDFLSKRNWYGYNGPTN